MGNHSQYLITPGHPGKGDNNMLEITAGHTVETGRKITGLTAQWYNKGVAVYNNTGDPELKRALGKLWDYILTGGGVEKLYRRIMTVSNLIEYWKVID